MQGFPLWLPTPSLGLARVSVRLVLVLACSPRTLPSGAACQGMERALRGRRVGLSSPSPQPHGPAPRFTPPNATSPLLRGEQGCCRAVEGPSHLIPTLSAE